MIDDLLLMLAFHLVSHLCFRKKCNLPANLILIIKRGALLDFK